MKRILLFISTAVLTLAAAAQQAELETTEQILSYGIGLQVGRGLQQQGFKSIDADALLQAIRDVVSGQGSRLSMEKLNAAQKTFQEQRQKEIAMQANAAKAESEAFLSANRVREGVVELESGLQYRELINGGGKKPARTDTVSVHYRGTLLDGQEFDSSYKRGAPAEFGVGNVIVGWQEALQLMSVGSKWELWIPSDLAYGARGSGRAIGPNSTLYFEVELLGIK